MGVWEGSDPAEFARAYCDSKGWVFHVKKITDKDRIVMLGKPEWKVWSEDPADRGYGGYPTYASTLDRAAVMFLHRLMPGVCDEEMRLTLEARCGG